MRTSPLAWVLPILYALLLNSCSPESSQRDAGRDGATVRTDPEPIERRLPKVGRLEAVMWTARKVTVDSMFSPPEKAAYRIQGFAKLENAMAENFSRLYEWEKISKDKRGLQLPKSFEGSDVQWGYSRDFVRDVKPDYIPGEIFYEKRLRIVYFDLEIE